MLAQRVRGPSYKRHAPRTGCGSGRHVVPPLCHFEGGAESGPGITTGSLKNPSGFDHSLTLSANQLQVVLIRPAGLLERCLRGPSYKRHAPRTGCGSGRHLVPSMCHSEGGTESSPGITNRQPEESLGLRSFAHPVCKPTTGRVNQTGGLVRAMPEGSFVQTPRPTYGVRVRTTCERVGMTHSVSLCADSLTRQTRQRGGCDRSTQSSLRMNPPKTPPGAAPTFQAQNSNRGDSPFHGCAASKTCSGSRRPALR
jgi:hypothetical protein